MGTPRTREMIISTSSPGSYQPGYYSGSGWVNVGSPISGSALANSQSRSEDTIGPGPPYLEHHNLLIEHRKVNPLRLWGEGGDSFSVRRYSGWNPTNFTGYQYVTAAAATDWNYWKAKALASINPFRPQLDLPLFLFELREFPRMLKGLGDVLSGRSKARDVPGGYLSYNFGWAPLLSDLGSLLDFAKSLAKTRNALTNAANGGRVSHKLGDKSSTGLPTTYSYSHSNGTYILSATNSSKVKGWCTARVHLIEPLPLSVYDQELLIFETTLGLNLRPAMIWDAIPWTWLIDYFTNIGDLMEARGGYNRWSFHDLYVMVMTSKIEKISHTVNQVGSLSYTGGTKSYIRKERSYVGYNPNVGLGLSPMLTDYQSGILVALLTAAALRSSR